MGELRSDDGRYFAVQQGDGNFVVYDTQAPAPNNVWDRWSYEGGRVPPVPAPAVEAPAIIPSIESSQKRGMRVTGPEDGELLNRGYSYWSQAWIGPDGIYAFCGHADGKPRFFRIGLQLQSVDRLGPLLGYSGTSEGWYWHRDGRLYFCDGPRLRSVDLVRNDYHVVVDISDRFPGCTIWQAHSSDDGFTHSMTIRQPQGDAAALKLGTAVYRDGALLRFEAPTLGELDESAISGNGRYLIIKEGEDDDNRILDLEGGTERILRKAEGALGHSDCGPDWAVGDDRTQGSATWMNLANPDDRRVLKRFPDWNMGHVSVKAGRCLLTHGDSIGLLDVTSGDLQVLQQHGMVNPYPPDDPRSYDYQVFANLDPSGSVFAYMSNAAGRMDLYLGVI